MRRTNSCSAVSVETPALKPELDSTAVLNSRLVNDSCYVRFPSNSTAVL